MAYIDANALLENLKKQYGEDLGWQCPVNMSDVGMMIENAPTADVVEVKRGEWIIDNSIEERTFYDTNYKILITCNICGNRHFLGTQSYRNFTQEDLKEDAYRKYRYCGECGAKMDGGKKE